MRLTRCARLSVLILCAAAALAAAEESLYLGRSIADVIDGFRNGGLPVAYSTMLVSDDLQVTVEPDAHDPVSIMQAILAPHGLTLKLESGVWLVVRDRKPLPPDPAPAVPDDPVERRLEEIAVSASRYEIPSEAADAHFTLDRQTIQSIPTLGDDPMRAVQRLPGAAAGGASAKTHFRGGDEDEIGILLNGHRLFDPFHVRDFQNIFSAIDARAIEGVEVYTGGFPVRYGERMSGIILMQSLEPPNDWRHEIGISVYNTSLLTTGASDRANWLLSVRRGNLDLVIDPEYGSPSYADVFAELGVELTPDAVLTFNALYADDGVKVVLESDPSELEQVHSDTRNLQLWLQLDNRWSDRLSSHTILSAVDFDNLRRGTLDDPEKITGYVTDARRARQIGFRQDFSFRASDHHVVQWGLEVRHNEADYDYENHADYFELNALYPDQPESIDTRVLAAPDGGSYALYVADRWRFASDTVLEWGLRWDDQTYTGSASDSQLSPRISLLQYLGDRSELRVSWGRYHQAQEIHELQVEDGIAEFWPAQRADHVIVSYRYAFDDDNMLRIEAFHKELDSVRPRFENLFDPLGIIPEVQPDRVRIDAESALATGVELSFEHKGGPFEWWASYVLADASDRIDGTDVNRSWHQRHALQGGIRWHDEDWDVGLAASIHSGWPLTELALVEDGVDADGEPEYVAVPGPRNAGQYDTFASLDFRISRKWLLPRGRLTAFFEVSNLTNRRNPCCLDWDLADDDPSGAVALERGVDYWLPLLPAVGVLWEF